MRFSHLGLAAILAVPATSICFADSVIYAMSAGNSGVQVYDANTGDQLQTIVTSEMRSNNGRGVVKVGDILYYTGASQNSVFGFNLKTSADLGVVFSVAGSSGLATMAFDGTDLYLGDYSGTNNVYKYSLGGTLLQTIPLSQCTGFCDGLEYAQGHLISNERDGANGPPSAYDSYSLNGTLLTKNFITATFGATGIAYDGTDFWVSDVYGGRLDRYDASGKFIGVTTLKSPTFLVEDLSFDYSQVLGTPEPGSILLLGLGLMGVAGYVRHRNRR
jgi:PEP-CTERM motif